MGKSIFSQRSFMSASTNNSQNNGMWFGVSMALVGIIVGYGFATLNTGGSPGSFGGSPVAQVPTPSAPTPSVPTPAAPAVNGDNTPPVDAATDHIRGELDATISIIEYSDFECPFCQRHHPTMVQVLDEQPDDVNWVYRHYPLAFHPKAMPAAVASECVASLGGNGAFWNFTDKLFSTTTAAWDYEAFASEAGIDPVAMADCLANNTFEAEIQAEMTAGSTAGVTGTPGNIVINNKTGKAVLVSGAQPASAFTQAIESVR